MKEQRIRSRRSTKIIAAIAALGVAAPVAAASGTSAAARAAKPVYGGSAKVAIFDTFPGFCVSNNPANSALHATRTVYETLVERTIGGDYVGLLARGYSKTRDMKSWTFTLRSGIRFHDGTAFNADAVIANFNAITGRIGAGAFLRGQATAKQQGKSDAEALAAGRAALGGVGYTIGTGTAFTSNIKAITKVNDLAVRFDLDRAQNDFPATLYASGRFVMRAPAQLADAKSCSENPIGTGPFKIVSWNPNQMVVEKNASYWRTDPVTRAKLPYLDRITFTNVKEGSQRAAAVRRGTYDAGQFTVAADSTFIRDLRKRRSVVREWRSATEYYPSVWLNQGRPGSPFKNADARKAVLSCIDLRSFNNVRLRGLGKVPKSLVGNKSTMYDTRGFQSFSVTKAKKYVAAYKKATGAKRLEFTFNSDVSTSSTSTAKFLQAQWRKCGITARFTPQETAVVISNMFNASPNVAAGQYYNAYDLGLLLLFEGNDVAFNAPFVLSDAYQSAASAGGLGALYRGGVGRVLSLNHHGDTRVDKFFYDGQAAASKAGARNRFRAGTRYLQRNAYMGSLPHYYYSLFVNNKSGLQGIGKLKLQRSKTQRIMTNWGIDWTGVWKSK
ncbi:MAG: ABC transporter substrate-binding protein [Ilumatobacteraceae bacterium]